MQDCDATSNRRSKRRHDDRVIVDINVGARSNGGDGPPVPEFLLRLTEAVVGYDRQST